MAIRRKERDPTPYLGKEFMARNCVEE